MITLPKITMAAVLFLIGLILYYRYYPYNIIEFTEVKAVQEEYRTGDVFDIEISYCKNMPLTADMTRQFMNGIIFTLSDDSSSNVLLGCHTHTSTDIIIPKELLPDDYIYKQTMRYHPNPIREVTVVFEVPLKVVE